MTIGYSKLSIKKNTDYRIAIQLADYKNGRPYNTGIVNYSPWLSEGGGWTAWASNSIKSDPDVIRFKIESRPREGFSVSDIKLGIQLKDGGYATDGTKRFTSSMNMFTQMAWTGLAGDNNYYDPDYVRIYFCKN